MQIVSPKTASATRPSLFQQAPRAYQSISKELAQFKRWNLHQLVVRSRNSEERKSILAIKYSFIVVKVVLGKVPSYCDMTSERTLTAAFPVEKVHRRPNVPKCRLLLLGWANWNRSGLCGVKFSLLGLNFIVISEPTQVLKSYSGKGRVPGY